MIKLIASDIDGTLVKDSTPLLYDEMKQMIRELKQRGIYFVAASGRGYNSIRNLFQGVEDDIIYICSNGACIIYQGKILKCTPIPTEHMKNIILDCRKYQSAISRKDTISNSNASNKCTNELILGSKLKQEPKEGCTHELISDGNLNQKSIEECTHEFGIDNKCEQNSQKECTCELDSPANSAQKEIQFPDNSKQCIFESPSDCELSASTDQINYLESKNQEYIDLIHYGYRNRYKLTDDLIKEEQPFIKISLYRKAGIESLVPILIPKWSPYVKATVAGKEWIDFMDRSVDKGNALSFLMEHLNIKKEETIAFGDNGNDVGMMKAAGRSFAVENAVSEVINASTDRCPGWADKGVYQILKKLFSDI